MNKWFKYRPQWNYKKMYPFYWAVLCFIVYGIFMIAIQPTITLWNVLKQEQKKVMLYETIPIRYKQLIQGNGINTTQSGTSIEAKTAAYCTEHQLNLSFLVPITKQVKNLNFITHHFVVSGSFQHITQLVYFIEQEASLGTVTSLHYQLMKHPITRMDYLQADIYLQTYSIP